MTPGRYAGLTPLLLRPAPGSYSSRALLPSPKRGFSGRFLRCYHRWDAQPARRRPQLNRRTFFGWGISIAAIGALPLVADPDKQKHRGPKHDRGPKGKGGHSDRYFRQDDLPYLREHYHVPADIPPGLRKKYYRTGTLPPGWEKRFRPFPPALIRRLPPPPPYCERGYVDGFAVVYDRRSRIIVDVLDLVDAVAGR